MTRQNQTYDADSLVQVHFTQKPHFVSGSRNWQTDREFFRKLCQSRPELNDHSLVKGSLPGLIDTLDEYKTFSEVELLNMCGVGVCQCYDSSSVDDFLGDKSAEKLVGLLVQSLSKRLEALRQRIVQYAKQLQEDPLVCLVNLRAGCRWASEQITATLELVARHVEAEVDVLRRDAQVHLLSRAANRTSNETNEKGGK